MQCTKALVFFDMQVNVMKINAANEQGDTPLHLASRWGYGKIIWVVPICRHVFVEENFLLTGRAYYSELLQLATVSRSLVC